MKTRLMVETPHDVVFTMKITMTAKEWESLREAMDKLDLHEKNKHGPVRMLMGHITDLLAQARKVFYPIPSTKEEGE